MKRAIILVLVSLMILSGLCFSAPAFAETTSGGFTYEVLEDGTASITGCSLSGDVTIPSEIDGKTVTNLAKQLFYGKTGVTSVSIPATVTYFGDSLNDNMWDYVFSYCYDLKSITVDANNTVFCSVDGVLYSKDKTILINYPAKKEGKTFHVTENVTDLCCTSFASVNNLKKLYLDGKNTWWYTYTFYNCGSLTVYYQPGGQTEQKVNQEIQGGRSYADDTSRPVFINAAEQTSGGNEPAWSLSDAGVLTISGTGVIGSAPWAEDETIGKVKEVVIGEGITGIGASAFQDCSALEKATLPATLTTIGTYAFVRCPSLTEITLPAGITTVGASAFDSSLRIYASDVTTCESISRAGYRFRASGEKFSRRYLFDENGNRTGLEIGQADEDITAAVIPEGTTVIGYGAFENCRSLKEVTLPDSLTEIGAYAFYNCRSLEELTLPDQISSINWESFTGYDGALFAKEGTTTAQTLDDKKIDYRLPGMNYTARKLYDDDGNRTGLMLVSVDASLTSFTIPADITDIGESAFRNNPKLQKLTVPAAIKQIGSKAFAYYGGYVEFQGDAPAFADDAFQNACTVAIYPHDKADWTETIKGKYGATTLIWQADNEKKDDDQPKDTSEELQQEETSNESSQDIVWNTSSPVDSYLSADEDGSLLRVEHVGENVVVEMYTADMKLTWKKTLEMELPIWGGFFAGKEYNFLVEGQSNYKEDDSVEVVRVIRYSKNWHRVDSVSVFGHNTILPFAAGSLRMTESDNFLYIHTCHQMYKSSDGLNHQANMSYQIYVPTMTITRENYLVSNAAYDYVSHSFDQHVITDGADIIKVDLGDAYPRSLTLMRIADSASSPGYGQTTRVTLMKITGEIGANYTGVSVGGLTASSARYIVAGTSVDQNNFDTSNQRNIFIVSVPKNDLRDETVSFRWITSHAEGSGTHVSTPQLVNVDGAKQMLLWSEQAEGSGKQLKYVFLDANGAPSSGIYTADGRLSDCKPIVRDGKVMWYVTEYSGSVFYIIDPADPGTVQKAARNTWVKLTTGWYYYNGDGEPVTGWLTLDGLTYYLDAQGLMVTGWQTIDGKHYLFADSGEAQKERWYTDDAGQKYYLGADGAAATGLATVKEYTYTYNEEKDDYDLVPTEKIRFFNADGVMQTGWVTEDGKYYYFDSWGDMATNRWISEDRDDGTYDRYYLGDDGVMKTGMFTLRESREQYNYQTDEYETIEMDCTYYCDESGRMQTGWVSADGKDYYFNTYGQMAKNEWIKVDGKEYCMGEDGAMRTGFATKTVTDYDYDWNAGQWIYTEKTVTCYLSPESGTPVTGWQQVDGVYYCFDENGAMRTGWYRENGAEYYLAEDGKMATGDVEIDGIVYHFSESGQRGEKTEAVSAGWSETDAGWVYVKEDGTKATDWLQIDGEYYCFDENGVMRTGWYEENGFTYYLEENGKMATGDVEINGKTYRFNEGGACTGEAPTNNEPGNPQGCGWVNTDAGWVYVKENGTKATGWLADGGDWYYMNADGIMQTGWVSDGGAWYYMKPGGTMATGWVSDGGAWYYMKSSGAMATGWVSDGGAWYYMKSSGAMATGWIYDGAWYYMQSSGAMATGWVSDGGAWYYMQSSGAMATGWQRDGWKWYYFNNSGAMVTGWRSVGGTWYYFRDSGAMATGWFEDKDAEAQLPAGQQRALWYWFDDNGAMATGWKEIDGRWEMFSDSGEWLYTWVAE